MTVIIMRIVFSDYTHSSSFPWCLGRGHKTGLEEKRPAVEEKSENPPVLQCVRVHDDDGHLFKDEGRFFPPEIYRSQAVTQHRLTKRKKRRDGGKKTGTRLYELAPK